MIILKSDDLYIVDHSLRDELDLNGRALIRFHAGNAALPWYTSECRFELSRRIGDSVRDPMFSHADHISPLRKHNIRV